jgi:hypothetical protein
MVQPAGQEHSDDGIHVLQTTSGSLVMTFAKHARGHACNMHSWRICYPGQFEQLDSLTLDMR